MIKRTREPFRHKKNQMIWVSLMRTDIKGFRLILRRLVLLMGVAPTALAVIYAMLSNVVRCYCRMTRV